jgi:hypothetical protein
MREYIEPKTLSLRKNPVYTTKSGKRIEGREFGGSVDAGQEVVVGEKRPETFVPSTTAPPGMIDNGGPSTQAPPGMIDNGGPSTQAPPGMLNNGGPSTTAPPGMIDNGGPSTQAPPGMLNNGGPSVNAPMSSPIGDNSGFRFTGNTPAPSPVSPTAPSTVGATGPTTIKPPVPGVVLPTAAPLSPARSNASLDMGAPKVDTRPLWVRQMYADRENNPSTTSFSTRSFATRR